jgi:TP901 family phage tail tape measure protein
MAGVQQELLRLRLAVEGQKDLEAMADQLVDLAKAGEVTEGELRGLVDQFRAVADQQRTLASLVSLKANINETADALVKARLNAAKLQAEFDASAEPTAKLSRQLQRANQEVDRLASSFGRQNAALARAEGSLAKAGIDTNRFAESERKLADQAQRAANALKDYTARAQASADASGRAGQAGKDAGDKLRRGAEGADSFGATLGRITPIAAGVALALKGISTVEDLFLGSLDSARAFERELDAVKAVSGATAAEMDQFRAAAERASSVTKFTALEAAQALGELARATGSAQAAIAALPATTALAQAAGLELAESAQFITTALTQFGLQADQAGRVADVLAKAANSTTADVRGLGLALSYSAPLARQLGMNLEETTAIIGALADQGFRGERAGTALRNVFTQLADPTSEFSQALLGAGVAGGDFIDIIEGLAKSGDRGKRALKALDAEARPAILALVNSGAAGLKQLRVALDDAAGSAQKTADVMGDNFDGAVKRFVNSIDAARKALVDPLLEPLKKQFDEAAVRIRAFIETAEFDRLKESVTSFALSATEAFIKFISAVKFDEVLASVEQFATESKEFFTDLGETADTVLTSIKIVVNAIAAAFNGLTLTVKTVAATVIEVLAATIRASYNTASALNELLPAYAKQDESLAKLKAKYENLEATAADLWKGVKKDADEVGGAIDSIVDGFKRLGEQTEEAATPLGKLWKALFEPKKEIVDLGNKLGLVADYSTKLGSAVQTLPGPLRDLGREALLSANHITEASTAFQQFGGGPVQDAMNALREAQQAYSELLKSGERSPVVLAAAGQAITDAQKRLDELRNSASGAADAANLLETAAKALGLNSFKAVEDAATNAAAALKIYIGQQRQGLISQEALNKAFESYAEKQLELAEISNESARARILNEVRVNAAMTGNTAKLDELLKKYEGLAHGNYKVADAATTAAKAVRDVGDAGDDAGRGVEAGADRAKKALDSLGPSANNAASNAQNLGNASNQAATGLNNAAAAGQQAAGAALDVSQAFANAAQSILGLDRVAFNQASEEADQARELLETLKKKNAAYDEMAQRIEDLRRKFTTLGDEQLAQLAQQQALLEQNQKKKQEQLDQERQQLEQQNAAGPAASSGGVVRVEVVHVVKAEGGAGLTQRQFDEMLAVSGRNETLAKVFTRAIADAKRRAGF